MEKTKFLNQVQYYKNAIDVYSGPDPLKPRYDYIMWVYKTVGVENADVNTCLEQTLQKFQNDRRYSNDSRFVELLISFARLKGDRLKYFKELYECELGIKCSILYKAWSKEFLVSHKYIDAYNVLNKGIYNNAQPLVLLAEAQREIEQLVGRKVLLKTAGCEILGLPCICYKPKQMEAVEVENWEFNPLKPGEPDNFTCPLYLPEPEDPNKCSMYSADLIYKGSVEYQFEEIQAMKYFQKLENSKAKLYKDDLFPPTPNPPSSPSSSKDHQFGDVSCSAQSFTAHTKAAINLVQGMWSSPASEEPKRRESFKVPEVPKSVPVLVYNDSACEDSENVGISRTVSTGSKSAKSLRSEFGEQGLRSGKEHVPVKHQLIFGDGALEIRPGDDLATCIDPNVCGDLTNRPQVASDWNVDDLTCNTKVFNNFLSSASTPNTKPKDGFSTPQQPVGHSSNHQKSEAALSIILEASKETPSSGNSGNENKLPSTLYIERTLENLDLNNINNPFCPKLLESLLIKVNYPYNLSQKDLKNYHVVNKGLPNITKTLKLGDCTYTLSGESFKGAYAKVLKVTSNDKLYALKVVKPPWHWEYYICKEIRKRLEPEHMVYFSDIKSAFFFQNGSILVSDYAKYGTLLNVINQCKLSPSKPDPSIWLFFVIEVINAIYYLHSQCNIIHGDIKPDNFIVHSLPTQNVSGPFLQLIDFGCSIDMKILPKGSEFTHVITTDGFQCNEMKENKPWTYQTDLYGLAGTIYCILVGDYMKVVKKKDGYVLSRQLPRSHQALWNPIFAKLLNIDSSNSLPDLVEMRKAVKSSYDLNNSFTIRNAFNSLANILHGN